MLAKFHLRNRYKARYHAKLEKIQLELEHCERKIAAISQTVSPIQYHAPTEDELARCHNDKQRAGGGSPPCRQWVVQPNCSTA